MHLGCLEQAAEFEKKNNWNRFYKWQIYQVFFFFATRHHIRSPIILNAPGISYYRHLRKFQMGLFCPHLTSWNKPIRICLCVASVYFYIYIWLWSETSLSLNFHGLDSWIMNWARQTILPHTASTEGWQTPKVKGDVKHRPCINETTE